jgi:hypothetical protein
MDITNIRKVLNSETGQDLRSYLLMRLDDLKRIDNMRISLNPIKTAIEVRATLKAFKKLTQIINELTSLTGEIRKKDPRDTYL